MRPAGVGWMAPYTRRPPTLTVRRRRSPGGGSRMTQTNVPMQRARLLLQQGRYADAERELRQTLAADPNYPEAHAFLAEALLSQQRVDEAAVEVTLAVRQDPELELG